MKTHAIVLAAGKGTRMKSSLYKVMHPVCGKPMIQHIVDLLQKLSLENIVVVVGHGAEAVKEQLGDRVQFAFQPEQLGTAHAVSMCRDQLQGQDGITLVINGDTPLVKEETLQSLFSYHQSKQATATVLTTLLPDPTGYGRVIRDQNGDVNRIVEEKDATLGQKKVCEISTGIFCFDNRKLFESLTQVRNDNAQGEYYLPDVLHILKEQGCRVAAFMTSDPSEGTGVNDRVQLAQMEALMRKRICEQHMRNGVTLIDPSSTYIDADVEIEPDTVIHPSTFLRGRTRIGSACVIGPNADVTDCLIESHVKITQSTLAGSIIGEEATVGPFAYIRPQSEVGRGARVGDFVELKNTRIGAFSKVSHLSYLGDAEVGQGVNVGCGVITVNYDGVEKHRTAIEDESFIGCNVNLIAPVTVGEGAYVAAGSTITEDVPRQALAIARQRQQNKEAYSVKKKLQEVR
ncbi:bifunctional UDP-N-acetylglucosamine diphosphorylase/glucosamine-1-phosphate N-acetyltransferase GlmU [Brevibacillus fluminis]|uniref:Bifunctional protein GlmU n=1 Tax=Brevibacillus fluminis TaxID=511487 RepID=A0A3M8DU00_9BACL|nr:bifunctional UDP-N-acetylglucosamine diphosphorylase/glucosamine-1-phosphate N-acetyltransferase GlmU [Brevibacillus fluminis]RNB90447.1 bifunctional UDP-N-acetylglucosamine diphosphorylase/glucosamine-1-phosphate N-acetyltransferase GlmU [Brevibacillus fluminis]